MAERKDRVASGRVGMLVVGTVLAEASKGKVEVGCSLPE